ncbi:MAG: glycosyltransferase [bacterium]
MMDAISKKSRAKIAVIMPTLQCGGAQKVVITIGNKLIEKGLNVDIILYKRIITCPVPFKGNIISIFNNNVRLRKHPFFLTKKIINILKEYNIVVGGLGLDSSFLAMIWGRLSNKKTVSLVHIHISESINGVLRNLKGLKGLLFKIWTIILYRFISKFVSKFVCVSEEIKQDLIKSFKLPSKKMKVILNPLDIADTRMRACEELSEEQKVIFEKPTIIFVGRMEYRKGLDFLLKAFRILLENHNVNLIIVGEQDITPYKILVNELGIEKNVFFLGLQENQYKFMARSKVLVFPSRYEGFGVVLVEAMACGIPVIASDCPCGPSEILDRGKYGILVGVGDIDGLAKNIELLLTNNNLHEKFSTLGKQRAEDFDIDTLINHYMDILL